MKYPRIMIAGASSRVGKTTVAMGIISALKKRGLKVQPFKAGPDYIDPSYHTMISGKSCKNLDTWMLSRNAVLELFERSAKDADISVIEGVMGLYDGLKDTEEGSSAHLAKITKTPVILVVDISSMSRSSGAIVLGYKEFDKTLNIRGVILNNAGSPSHYDSAKRSIEKRTSLPVLGYLPKNKKLILAERHLGLVPTGEKALLSDYLCMLTELVEANIDIKKIIDIGCDATSVPHIRKDIFGSPAVEPFVAIAVAKDEAFNFYYQDNLDILSHYGAKLVEFSPLNDKRLPDDLDGLYIGGGFPELYAKKLSANKALKNDIYKKAEKGLPIYAECGGLMYLVNEIIEFNNKKFPMIGIFDASIKMANRLSALGYIDIEVTRDNILSSKSNFYRGHVFHWSRIENVNRCERFSYRLNKAGRAPSPDGLTKWNVLAGYAHLHFGADPMLAGAFIDSCAAYREKA